MRVYIVRKKNRPLGSDGLSVPFARASDPSRPHVDPRVVSIYFARASHSLAERERDVNIVNTLAGVVVV